MGSSPTAGASLIEAQPLFLEGVALSVSAPIACRYTLGTHFSLIFALIAMLVILALFLCKAGRANLHSAK